MKYLHCLAILLLAGCSGSTVKDTLGLSREAPDEFRVVSRPPLSMPPQFSLRPPSLTDQSPTMQSADQLAQEILRGADNPQAGGNQPGGPVVLHGASSAESQFLRNVGAERADPNVRTTLVEERIVKQEEEGDSWWNVVSNTEKKEPMVDARKEADRIAKNEEEGKPVTEGETPETGARDTGVLGRVFGY